MNNNAMDDSTRDLFIRGMVAAKAKESADARRYLEWVLRLDPPLDTRVDTLYWLAQVAETPAEQSRLLEEALAFDPSDMRCRRALALVRGELNPEEIIDPDRLPDGGGEPARSPRPTTADRFTCPQCGGRMTFAADGQSLTCEFCEARGGVDGIQHRTAATSAASAENFLIAMATRKGHLHPVTRQTFNCQGCGIDFLLSPQQLSITCPYCGSAYAIRAHQSRELIDPHLILPFIIDENQANQAFSAWLVKENLTKGQVEPPAAVYLPAWSFEMTGQVPWSCLVEEGRNQWIPKNGREIVYHSSVIVPASSRTNPEIVEEMRAFDLKQAAPFDERYLVDWPAETYQVSVGDASLEARRWTYEFEKQSVRQRMLRRVRDLMFNSSGITVEAFQLVLLPLWLAHYHLDETRFEAVINGRNAAVRGQRPLNWLEKLIKR